MSLLDTIIEKGNHETESKRQSDLTSGCINTSVRDCIITFGIEPYIIPLIEAKVAEPGAVHNVLPPKDSMTVYIDAKVYELGNKMGALSTHDDISTIVDNAIEVLNAQECDRDNIINEVTTIVDAVTAAFCRCDPSLAREDRNYVGESESGRFGRAFATSMKRMSTTDHKVRGKSRFEIGDKLGGLDLDLTITPIKNDKK